MRSVVGKGIPKNQRSCGTQIARADRRGKLSFDLEDLRGRTNKRESYVKLGLKLRIRRRKQSGCQNRHRCSAGWRDERRAMRNDAQRAVRSRQSLLGQGVVYVYGLHKTETGHHQHEEQRCPFPEQRAIELVDFVHTGRPDTTIQTLDARVEAQEAEVSCIFGTTTDRICSLFIRRQMERS